MERAIGDEFGFLGYVLKVEKAVNDCSGCFFFEHNLACHHKEISSVIGVCKDVGRSNNQDVIFTKIM